MFQFSVKSETGPILMKLYRDWNLACCDDKQKLTKN